MSERYTGGLGIVKNFESDSRYFEMYMLRNRKPVESFKNILGQSNSVNFIILTDKIHKIKLVFECPKIAKTHVRPSTRLKIFPGVTPPDPREGKNVQF